MTFQILLLVACGVLMIIPTGSASTTAFTTSDTSTVSIGVTSTVSTGTSTDVTSTSTEGVTDVTTTGVTSSSTTVTDVTSNGVTSSPTTVTDVTSTGVTSSDVNGTNVNSTSTDVTGTDVTSILEFTEVTNTDFMTSISEEEFTTEPPTKSPPLITDYTGSFGRVFIGEDLNDTQALYTYNENFDGTLLAVLPVYLVLYNDTTGEELGPDYDLSDNVAVTCELGLPYAGYTNVTFIPEPFYTGSTPPALSGTVTFTIISAGRESPVQCWGVSVTSADKQFTKDMSISPPKLFEVFPPGQVNILPAVVIVPNTNTQPARSSFDVELSEVVQRANVTVSCSVVETNMTALYFKNGVCSRPLDITFVVDQSGSIVDQNPADGSYDNWNLMREFIVAVVDSFNVGLDKTRIALVTFGNEGVVVFNLNRYRIKTDVKQAIRAIPAGNGNTNTYDGLRKMRTSVFQTAADRKNAANVAIVITDGRSTWNRELTIPEAEAAQKDGVIMFAVGITNSVNLQELASLSSPPHTAGKNYWTTPDFLSLPQVVTALQRQACTFLSRALLQSAKHGPFKDPMIVIVQSATVPIGKRSITMLYEASRGNPVLVQCNGQSLVAQRSEGQFYNETSGGLTAEFVISNGSLTLVPQRSSLRVMAMNSYIYLDALAPGTVTLYCQVLQVYDQNQADIVASNPECQIPASSTTRAPFTSSNDTSGNSTSDSATTSSPTIPPTVTSTSAPDTTTLTDTTITTDTLNDTSTVATVTQTDFTSALPTVNLTAEWKLVQDIIEIQIDQLYAPLRMYRTQPVDTYTEEMLILTCCAPADENKQVPDYANKSASLQVSTYMYEDYPVNWTASTPDANKTDQSSLLNPAYQDMAACPCDMTANYCNPDCCCDPDCTADQLLTFTACIPGIAGGYGSDGVPRQSCAAAGYTLRPDWFPLMCVQWNNTAYLGQIYYPQMPLRDSTTYRTFTQDYRSPYSYQVQTASLPANESATGYVDGVSVKTGVRELDQTVHGTSYRLTLPQHVLSGACLWTAPVRFQHDTYTTCVHELTESTCLTPASPLNAQVLAQSPRWNDRVGPMTLQDQGVSDITEININYLCAGDNAEYLQNYVRSDLTYDEVVLPGQSYLFNYSLPMEGGLPNCIFSNETSAYICGNQTIGGSEPTPNVPPRCSWDDSFTKPPAPALSSDKTTCMNIALSVYYNFTWSGRSIIYLNATVVLGDVSLKTSKGGQTVLTPEYESKFVSSLTNFTAFTSYVSETGNITRPVSEEQYQRSGNPGYDVGLPVLSGIAVPEDVLDEYNDTAQQFSYMDMNVSSQLGMWLTGSDGLCYNTKKRPVQFRINAMSNCMLRLGLHDLLNCDYLRSLVLNRQDALMPSGYISLVGDPPRNETLPYWTNIFRQDLSYLFPNTTDTNGTDYTYYTSTVLPTTTTAAMDNFTDTSPQTPNTDLASIIGICPNIPSGINLDVMYAKAGEALAKPIYQIVGAAISYTLSTWQLRCSGPSAEACYSNATWLNTSGEGVQPFILTATTNYIEVPPTPPATKSKYAVENAVPDYVCRQDACWGQIFYPFLKLNPGNTQHYTVPMGLLSLIVLLGLFLMMRPVSRW